MFMFILKKMADSRIENSGMNKQAIKDRIDTTMRLRILT